MPVLSVIVIGGGLGGLTAATALRQAGHEVTILEKYTFSGEVGAAVGLSSNVISYLQTLGFDIERAKLCRASESQFLDGRSLQVSTVIEHTDILGGTIFRADLRDELRLLAEDSGCQLIELSSVSTIDPDGGFVCFEDGSQRQADLIVSADGIHSTAMDLVLRRPFPATRTDFTATRAVIPTDKLRQSACAGTIAAKPGRTTFSISPGGGGYLLCYWCHAFEYMNVVLYRYGVEDDMKLAGDTMRDETTRADVAASLAQFHPDLGTICDHLLEVLPLWRLSTRPPAERYTRGRLVVLGDAAHAMLSNLGQGANTAMLDAAALGTLFANNNTPVEEGEKGPWRAQDISRRLDLYDKIRVPRISATQIWSEIPMFENPLKRNGEVKKFLPDTVLPETMNDLLMWLQTYDVVQHCRNTLQEHGLG